jgi:hypothetical protein
MGFWLTRPLVLAATVLLCPLVVTACSGSSAPRTARSSSASQSKEASPPKTLTARRLRPVAEGLRPGTRLNRGFTGMRVFANRSDGFAITDLPHGSLRTYPVKTTDGGKTWRTDGPVLYVPAARGPLVVTRIGVVGPRISFAWCAVCGPVIDVTTDAGKRWWQTFIPGTVLTVFGGDSLRARLISIVKGTSGPHGREMLWTYVSSDGRRWTYDHTLRLVR